MGWPLPDIIKKELIYMNPNWQETLVNELSTITEDQRQRAHDFLVGYIAAMQEEVKPDEAHQD